MKEDTLAFYDIFRKTISYSLSSIWIKFEKSWPCNNWASIGNLVFETDFNNLPVLEGSIFMENDFPQNIGFQIMENGLKLA